MAAEALFTGRCPIVERREEARLHCFQAIEEFFPQGDVEVVDFVIQLRMNEGDLLV